jgi:flagellar assembly protein FliH
LCRIVVRDALPESEVQPYREVDVRTLLLGRNGTETWQRESQGPEEHEGSGEVDAPLYQGTAAPLSTLAPLLFLMVAQARAEEIVTQAHHQAEVLQQEAYDRGLARGREEGREQIRKELLPALSAFVQARQSLIALEEQLVSRLTPEIVRLAVEIAEKIVGKKVEEDPQVTLSVLERARAEIPQARHVRIWLHPADYHALVDLHPELMQVREEGGRRVEVLTSEDISRGGCCVETEMGVIDATIPTQVQEISRQLLDEGM